MRASSLARVRHLPALRRHFGTRWLAGRALYALQLRTGVLRRRLPTRTWDDRRFADSLSDPSLADAERYLDYRRAHAPSFFFSAAQREGYAPLLTTWDNAQHSPVLLADSLARGVIRYFEHTDARCGVPPDWHVNPFTGERAPAAHHWSAIGDFGCGDIKVI